MILALLACRLPTPEEVSGLPAGWLPLTDPEGGFEVAFPAEPTLRGGLDERRWEVTLRQGSFTAYRAREPDGAVAAAGGAEGFTRSIGERFLRGGAEFADVREWPVFQGGRAMRMRLPAGEGDLWIGVDGDLLFVLEAMQAPGEARATFGGSFRRLAAVEPTRVALPVGSAECPARCAAVTERVLVGARAVDATGFQGLIGPDRFDARVAPGDAADALRALFVGAGTVTAEDRAAGEIVVRYTLGRGIGAVRLVPHAGDVVALRVFSPRGTLPPWADGFLASLR